MNDVKFLSNSNPEIYILNYPNDRFSDEEKSKFINELTNLGNALDRTVIYGSNELINLENEPDGSVIYGSREYFRGKRFIIHGMSADGTEFTHIGELIPYQNIIGYNLRKLLFGIYYRTCLVPTSEFFCFNHLVEFKNTFRYKNGGASSFNLKYLFNGNGFFDKIDPSCLYILDICDEASGEKIVENINKKYFMKKIKQLKTEKKQSGTDIEGSKLDPVSQKLYENIGKPVILNGKLDLVSSFKINDDGFPCVVLGNDMTKEIVIDGNSSVIVPLPYLDKNPEVDFIWSDPITNNPKEFADIVSKRKEYMNICKTNSQPSSN